MVETKERFREEDGWEKIPDEDDFWCPCDEGDWIAGIYKLKEEDVGRNHANVYTLANTEGEFRIFGTVGLNKKMDSIPIGYEVGIIYKGEKPSQPPKKPFKLFEVSKREVEHSEDTEVPKENPLAGDENAMLCIDELTEDLLADNTEPTEAKIIEKAKEYHIQKLEGYTDPKILGRIEKELKRKG